MTNCGNCGRPLGDAFERGECAYPLGVTCVEAARTRPTHDALRRDLADAKAEVERLRKLFDDAGQGEHNVLALVDHYIAEAERAEGEVERLRGDVADLVAERDGYSAACTISVRQLAAEADELRRLAWEWCIAARDERLRAALEQARAQRAIHEAAELEHNECPPQSRGAGGPLDLLYPTHQIPTFTLREPDPPIYIDPAHEPIASLGPVPVTGLGEYLYDHKVREVLAWLIRDAVRRGAKLEGGE